MIFGLHHRASDINIMQEWHFDINQVNKLKTL